MSGYDLLVLIIGCVVSLALIFAVYLIRRKSKNFRREIGLISNLSDSNLINNQGAEKSRKGFDILSSKYFILFLDIVFISFSFVFSYFLRINFSFDFIEVLQVQLPIVLAIFTCSIVLIGSHKGMVLYTGARDIYLIFNVVCISTIFCIFFVILNNYFEFIKKGTIPLSVIVINAILSIAFLISYRYFFKSVYMYKNFKGRGNDIKNVIIYGAGSFGVIAHHAMTTISPGKSSIKVIGYIDDDQIKIGRRLNGLPIYSSNSIDANFIEKRRISEIVIAKSNLESRSLRKIIEPLIDFNVEVKIVPSVDNWINGELKFTQIKRVFIEDLLERPIIGSKKTKIGESLKDKTIIITGGAGSIGSEICKEICKLSYHSLVVVDNNESALRNLIVDLKQSGFHNFIPIVGDVSDKGFMTLIFEDYKPNLVFHAAGYKDVPLLEYNVYEAIKSNVKATKILADLSTTFKVDKFVQLSTDKAVNPTNVVGVTKRIAEIYLQCLQQESNTKFITCRFGNLLGANGSVIPLFRKQIEKGGPLTVTHKEITRYFMTIPEATQLILESSSMGQGGEVFIFDMGESVKIFELAKNMIRLSGLKYPDDIDIKITGLRPGEKLYEELLANGENTLPTYHKKIMICKLRDLDYTFLLSKIDELCVSNMFFNGDYNLKLMKDIVPEYITNNSPHTKFDFKSSEYLEHISKKS
ncbi:polysaccharide biosynthesis protein [Allomuricauda sp. M10]|uniref:polysaccharide biosynthesis protein n=1 Tax=Allomuricauda sp. M10 TaxID=2683292 RepID=UPI001D189402|nr:nucleoside-diphosphate sugar epimerase/dehydratase [Muricauda sp. M10]